MLHKIINPDQGIYATTADYVHGIEVIGPSRMFFTSGTMGLDTQGSPPTALDDQLALVWANLKTILAAADMGPENILRASSYLRDASYAEANQTARIAALGGRRIPVTTIVAKTLMPGWLVEIDIIASATDRSGGSHVA